MVEPEPWERLTAWQTGGVPEITRRLPGDYPEMTRNRKFG